MIFKMLTRKEAEARFPKPDKPKLGGANTECLETCKTFGACILDGCAKIRVERL